MLKSYRRRAFLLLALTALEPGIASAAQGDDGPTLWDVLSKTETPNAEISGAAKTGKAGADKTLVAVRRPLGPVPGITLAGTDVAGPRKHSGFIGAVSDWFGMLESRTGSKIKATGYSTLSLQNQSVSGSTAAYQSDQYIGQGSNGVYTDTDVTVDATLFKWFHYTTRISNSLFKNPNDNRVLMDYKTAHQRIQYGDINVSFQGNSLIDFSRYLHGIQIHNDWSPSLNTTLLYSETKATTQTIVLNGNNSAGPYYVYAGQIVDGSVQVRVDNQVLTSGTDFTLDSFNGQLNFLHNRIILQSSSIAVSFESLGYNSSQGNIYGMRVETQPKRGLTFGATYVAQTSAGVVANQSHTEQFNGFGVPTWYSTSAPIDPSQPLIITVGGLPLTPAQYQLDKTTLYTDRVYINLPVPSTTIVQIQYVPYNTSPNPGNRSIIGLDTKYSMGKLGTLSLETALSGLSVSNTNINGNAWTARADLNPLRNLHTLITLKDINPTFSSIQSPGFSQNEKSIDLSGDYSPTKRLKLNFDLELAHRPSYSGTTQFSVDTAGSDHFRQVSGGAMYTLSKNSSLNFTGSDITTSYAVGGFSTTENDALTYSQTIKSIGIDVSVNTNKSNVSSTSAILGEAGTTTGTLYTSNSSSYGGRFAMHWQAKKALNFQGAVSLNKIITDSGGSSTGSTAKDAQLSANFTGIRKVRLTGSVDYSDTGSNAINSVGSGSVVTPVVTPVATTTSTTTTSTNTNTLVGSSIRSALASMQRDLTTGGTTTGTSSSSSIATAGSLFGGGINSNLGGFGNQNNVLNSSLGYTSFGGKSLSTRLQMDITPRKDMQLGINLTKSSSLGDYQYNSDSDGFGLNMSWQLSEKMQFTANYNMQHLVYTGSFGGTDNHTAMMSFQGRPFGGKLGVQFGLQSMHTNSAFNNSSTATSGTASSTSGSLTNTSNDLTSISARLDYPLSRKQTLFVEMLDSITSGYLANEENDVRFGLDYSLTQTLKFSFGWQILRHTYADPANASLNYRASNLLAQFGVHF